MQQNATTHLNPQPSSLDGPNSEPTQISIIDLLLVLVRHKMMIIFVTFGAALFTIAFTLFMPNIYTATTLILPTEDEKSGMNSMMAQMGGLAGIAGGSIGGPTKSELYVSMLKSETVKDPIIDRFKLMNIYKAKFRVDAYNMLNANAIINVGKKDGIISISISDKDPKIAAEMANGYVEELGNFVEELAMSGAGKNRQFLEERLKTAKAELVRAGDELKKFQAKHKMLNVTEQAKASIDGIAQLRAHLTVQEVQLAAMQRQFTESSQDVKRARVEVDNLKAQIAKLEGAGGNSSIPSIGSVPQLGQDYLRLMRELKIQETIVELLTKQYEMARLSEAKKFPPFQVLQKAKVPERKSKPARASKVLLVSFSAFFFAVVYAFFRESFNRLPEEELKRWKLVRSGLLFQKN